MTMCMYEIEERKNKEGYKMWKNGDYRIGREADRMISCLIFLSTRSKRYSFKP